MESISSAHLGCDFREREGVTGESLFFADREIYGFQSPTLRLEQTSFEITQYQLYNLIMCH